ncbi:hypothetical protein EJ05DRAFT_497488 [Pseudovirgaria hyperparasitica]|uniref:ER membrane protein complex subunit 10 n=1 Tax=Pseudovirgaria hyperparasitica TaxID=470096 RepID=A0A6A6WDL3_9PEZI|nr:uncharacterized protein EJ05DRAFT_497488 [Pseudovirgaria hyperparasitica]KAF2760918.1 hypothetical protein EJ05DRAFT_497488 [Pseudovirgaria hyperparasitica]
MRISLSALALVPTLLLAAPQPLTIYTSPVSSTSNTPATLLTLNYDPTTLSAEILSYNPPKDIPSGDPKATSSPLTRIFLNNPSSSPSVATSILSFSPTYQKTLILHVDDAGEIYHIGFATSGRGVQSPPNKAGNGENDHSAAEDEILVEVVKKGVGPQVHFNKPVVLNKEGKVEGKEPEKSFIQKYWWAIALFLLIQLVAGGGGGDEKK